MFGLEDAYFNAVKHQADKLNDEYGKLGAKKKDDKVVAALITQVWGPVSTLIARDKFVWIAGYRKGRVDHDGNGNSLYE